MLQHMENYSVSLCAMLECLFVGVREIQEDSDEPQGNIQGDTGRPTEGC